MLHAYPLGAAAHGEQKGSSDFSGPLLRPSAASSLPDWPYAIAFRRAVSAGKAPALASTTICSPCEM